MFEIGHFENYHFRFQSMQDIYSQFLVETNPFSIWKSPISTQIQCLRGQIYDFRSKIHHFFHGIFNSKFIVFELNFTSFESYPWVLIPNMLFSSQNSPFQYEIRLFPFIIHHFRSKMRHFRRKIHHFRAKNHLFRIRIDNCSKSQLFQEKFKSLKVSSRSNQQRYCPSNFRRHWCRFPNARIFRRSQKVHWYQTRNEINRIPLWWRYDGLHDLQSFRCI